MLAPPCLTDDRCDFGSLLCDNRGFERWNFGMLHSYQRRRRPPSSLLPPPLMTTSTMLYSPFTRAGQALYV
jgi:hypothetical protein